jgi:hypothetical protein
MIGQEICEDRATIEEVVFLVSGESGHSLASTIAVGDGV